MDIVSLIKMYREKKGLTLSELAKLSGVSVSTLSRIEARETEKVDWGTVLKLKVALEISDFDLMMSVELYENDALNNMEINVIDTDGEHQCNVCSKYFKGTLVKDMVLGHRNQTHHTYLCKSCRRNLINKLRDTLE